MQHYRENAQILAIKKEISRFRKENLFKIFNLTTKTSLKVCIMQLWLLYREQCLLEIECIIHYLVTGENVKKGTKKMEWDGMRER